MADFPMWLKALIWLVVGGTIVYAIGALIHTATQPSQLQAGWIMFDVPIVIILAAAVFCSIWLMR